MVRSEQIVNLCLFLGLLALMTIEPLCSERPYTAARPPLTKRDNASSLPQVRIDHGLTNADDHIHAGLTRVDVTRWLNPAVMISSLLQTTVEFVLAGEEAYLLLLAVTLCCLCVVHWAKRKWQTFHRYKMYVVYSRLFSGAQISVKNL